MILLVMPSILPCCLLWTSLRFLFLSLYSLVPRAVVDKEFKYVKPVGHSCPDRPFLLPRARDGVQSQEMSLASDVAGTVTPW
jgi:hypothetical protein